LIVTCLMFLGSTVFLCFDVADLLKRMEIVFVENSNPYNLQIKLDDANRKIAPLFRTEIILFIFMLSLGDSIVVWRTWAICVGRRKWVFLPIATLIGSAISAIFELGCDMKTNWIIVDLTPSAAPVGAVLCQRADKTSFSLSYVTNIICTCLIAFQTWEHRKLMSNYLGSARRRTQVEKILVLIVESGFVYILLYTTQAIPMYGLRLSHTGLLVCNVFNAIIQQTIGIYPTLIIVLVKMQKSLWDAHEMSAAQCSGMQFAKRTFNRTVDTTNTIALVDYGTDTTSEADKSPPVDEEALQYG